MTEQLLHDAAVRRLHGTNGLIGRCLRVLLRLIEDEAERHDGNRRNQRSDHTEDDSEAEWCEELSGQALHEAERQEYDAGRHGGAEHGLTNGLHGLNGGTAPCLRADRHIFIHRTEAGLQDDDGVIDHHADAEYQRRHRDHVEGVAHRPHRDERGQNRNRDGGTDDEGCLPVTEEDEDDDHRDDDRDDHGLEYRGERALDHIGFVLYDDDIEVLILRLELVYFFHDLLRHGYRRGVLGLRDAQHHRVVPIVTTDGRLILQCELHEGDVLQVDRTAVTGDDRDILKRLYIRVADRGGDGKILTADAGRTGRIAEIRGTDELRHRRHGKVILLQLLRDQLDLNVLLLSAGRIHRRNRAQLTELRCDIILDVVVHIFLRRILYREVHGRLPVHAHLDKGRVVRTIRKLRLDGIHFFLQRVVGFIHIRTILILDDGHAIVFR